MNQQPATAIIKKPNSKAIPKTAKVPKRANEVVEIEMKQRRSAKGGWTNNEQENWVHKKNANNSPRIIAVPR